MVQACCRNVAFSITDRLWNGAVIDGNPVSQPPIWYFDFEDSCSLVLCLTASLAVIASLPPTYRADREPWNEGRAHQNGGGDPSSSVKEGHECGRRGGDKHEARESVADVVHGVRPERRNGQVRASPI